MSGYVMQLLLIYRLYLEVTDALYRNQLPRPITGHIKHVLTFSKKIFF